MNQGVSKSQSTRQQKEMIVYFTADKKSFQIVKPSLEFDGDWKGLAEAVSGQVRIWGREGQAYHHFEVY